MRSNATEMSAERTRFDGVDGVAELTDDVPFERFVVGVDELFLIDRRSRFVALRRRLGNRRVEVPTERGLRLCALARGVVAGRWSYRAREW